MAGSSFRFELIKILLHLEVLDNQCPDREALNLCVEESQSGDRQGSYSSSAKSERSTRDGLCGQISSPRRKPNIS